jgi:hypothetical protein
MSCVAVAAASRALWPVPAASVPAAPVLVDAAPEDAAPEEHAASRVSAAADRPMATGRREEPGIGVTQKRYKVNRMTGATAANYG